MDPDSLKMLDLDTEPYSVNLDQQDCFGYWSLTTTMEVFCPLFCRQKLIFIFSLPLRTAKLIVVSYYERPDVAIDSQRQF
jgi:hypothetical protein